MPQGNCIRTPALLAQLFPRPQFDFDELHVKTKKPLTAMPEGVLRGSLALTYFRERLTHYHWRGLVSRSCSGREGVVPRRYGHQTKLLYLKVKQAHRKK